MADANLIVKIGALLDSSLDRATRTAINRVRALGTEMSNIGTTLGLGLSAPLAAFGAAAINAGKEIESLKLALQTLEKTTEATERRFKELQEVAKLPGLGVKEAVQADLVLRSYGLTAERAKEATLAFGNALAAAGRGKADLAETVRQFGQLAASGKLTAENLKPIIERVPQVASLLREKFGKGTAEELRDLGVSSQQVIDTIISGLQRLPPVTGGLKNALENFSDTTEQALANVGKALQPFIERFLTEFAEPGIRKVEQLATSFAKLAPETQNFAVAAAGLATGLPIVAFTLGRVVNIAADAVALFTRFPALGIAAVGVGVATAAAVALKNIDSVNERLAEQERIRQAIENKELKLPDLKGVKNYDDFLVKLKALNQEFFDSPWIKDTGDAAVKKFKDAGGSFETGFKVIDERAKAASGAVQQFVKGIDDYKAKAIGFGEVSLQNAIILERFGHAEREAVRRGAELQVQLERLFGAQAGDGDSIARLEASLNRLSLAGGPLDGLFTTFAEASKEAFQFTEEQIKLATRATKDLVAEIAQIPGETRLVEEAWARVGLQITQAVPRDLKDFQERIFTDARRTVEKGGKDFEKATKANERAAESMKRHIERYMHQTARSLTDVIFSADSVGQAFTKMGREILKSLATAAIEAQLKKLTDTLIKWGTSIGNTGVGKVLGGLFGADLSKGAGGLVIKNATKPAADAANAAVNAANNASAPAAGAASSAASGVAGIVSAVGSVVSAVSGVISNFQLAGVNKSLDLIEKEVRYSQIHLLNILENSNKFWPWIQYSHDRLRQMLEVGLPIFNAASDQGLRIAPGSGVGGTTITFDLRGATFGGGTTQEAVEEMLSSAARRLVLAGGIAG